MKRFIRFLLIFFLIVASTIVYARYGGTVGLSTKEYKIDTKDIADSFDGIKIVHFSDLHYLRVVNKDMLNDVVNEINLINPDIVFFTGDLIDKDYSITDKDTDNLIELLSLINSKYGKYAVIGNHDYVKDNDVISNIYSNSGFSLLVNNYDTISNHSCYIGHFKEEEMFYLKSRGLNEKETERLLAKAFLLSNMDINFLNRNMILEDLKLIGGQ